MSQPRRTSAILLLILCVAALCALPWLLPPGQLVAAVQMLIAALFACAFNLLAGQGGMLSFGHAAYFGVGTFATIHAMNALGGAGLLPTPLMPLAGGVAGLLFGLVAGWFATMRAGVYFSMITLALAQMVYFVCVQAPFTGAEDGLQRIPRHSFLGLVGLTDDRAMYAFLLVILLAVVWGLQRLMEAPYGQVLLAIRDNEPRAISLGYDVQNYKLSAFAISAAIAGLAGGTKALALGFAGLPDAHWTQSGNVILMCLLGGLGTPLGPIVGAILIVTLESKLSDIGVIALGPFSLDLSTKVPIAVGLIFMICVMLFRRGIVGEIQALIERRKAAAAKS